MTNRSRYGGEGTKPIRKDRLLIAGVIVIAAILIPILIKGGCNQRKDPGLTVTSDGRTVGTTSPAGSTTPTTPAAASPTATPSGESDVDTAIERLLPTSSTPSPASSTAATPASTPSTPKPAASSPAPSSPMVSSLAHTVKQGETLQSIATAMGVSVRDLRASNQIYGTDAPAAGRVLYAVKNGLVHTVKPGQTMTDIATTYATTVQAIATANGISDPSKISAGARLVIPNVSSAFWDTVSALAKGKTSRFIWPLEGKVVSQFGWRVHPILGQRMEHTGIDIDVPEGTTVYASASGSVYFYGEQSGYGNTLILKHEGGYTTWYGHLKSSLVKVGQFVEQGQKVALSGNTGLSSGPHLHFEARNAEFPLDPLGGQIPLLP